MTTQITTKLKVFAQNRKSLHVFFLWFCICWVSHPLATSWQLNGLLQTVEPNNSDTPHRRQTNSLSEIAIVRVENVDHSNPFSKEGNLSRDWTLLYDSLLIADPLHYGIFQPLMAKEIHSDPEHKTWQITIHPHAKFVNGESVTAEDVSASLIYLMHHGPITYHYLTEKNLVITAKDRYTLTFYSSQGIDFDTMIQLGLMPITQKEYLSSSQPPESGGYFLKKTKRNQALLLEKNKHYWAMQESVRRNMYYFDTIKIILMKTRQAALEAFKRGDATYHWEIFLESWQQLKNTAQEKILLKEIPIQRPIGMNGFAFNQHKPYLKDLKVRQALMKAFDFNTINKNLFHNQYHRINSYFTNTPYQNDEDKPLLAYNLEEANHLLNQQGWYVKAGKRYHPANNKPVTLHLLISNVALMKIANIYKKQLEQLGITLVTHLTTQADYLYRLKQGNFDLAYFNLPIGQSTSETLLKKFIPASASTYDFADLFGFNDKVIIEKCQYLLNHPQATDAKINTIRSIDQDLMTQTLIIPFWYPSTDKIAYWQTINGPDTSMQIAPSNNFQYWWPATDNP